MTKDRGDVEGKEDPASAIWLEEQSAADCPQVRGGSRVTTDHWGAGGNREPGGATRPRVSSGAEGGRSQGRVDGPRWSEMIRGQRHSTS